MSKKDPLTLIEEADGEPRWLAQALNEIWQRLPPPTPPAPPAAPELPSWDPSLLAKLQLNETALPLASANRWLLAVWLKEMADSFLSPGDEGDSKEGFPYLFTLKRAAPSSGPQEKRGRV